MEPIIGTMVGDERNDDRLGDPSDEGRERVACRSSRARWTSSPASTAPASTSRCARPSTCWSRSPSATSRRSRTGSTGCRWSATSGGPDSCWRSSARCSGPTRPSGSTSTSRGSSSIPAYLAAVDDIVRDGHRVGHADAAASVAERAVAQMERLLAIAPEDIAGARADRRRRPGARASGSSPSIRDEVNPAYERYLEALARVPAARDGDDRTVGAARRRRDVRHADPRVDDAAARRAGGARHRVERLAAIQEERAADRRRASGSAIAAEAIAAHRPGREHGRPPATRCSSSHATQVRAELGGRAGVLRPHAARTTATSGRSRSSASPTCRSASTTRRPPTVRGAARTTSTHTTFPARPLHHLASLTLPRGEPRASLPALDRAGAPRPARAAAVRRHPREQRVHGRVGPVQRAAGRRDGPVSRRLGTARHARGAGHARRAPGHRHRHPRARMDARQRDRVSMEDIGTPHADAVIEIDRYIAMPGAGALVHDRHDRDRARATGRRRAGGRRVLAPRLPRPAPRARLAPAALAPPRARLTDRSAASARFPMARLGASPARARDEGGAACNVDIRFGPSFAMGNVRLAPARA